MDLRTLNIEEWLVRAEVALCARDQPIARTGAGEVNVAVHKSSVLSPLPFIIVIDVHGV